MSCWKVISFAIAIHCLVFLQEQFLIAPLEEMTLFLHTSKKMDRTCQICYNH